MVSFFDALSQAKLRHEGILSEGSNECKRQSKKWVVKLFMLDQVYIKLVFLRLGVNAFFLSLWFRYSYVHLEGTDEASYYSLHICMTIIFPVCVSS